MFHVELAPRGGIFGPLKSDLGVVWPIRGTDFIMGKKTKCKFLKTLYWADFGLLESNSIYIFVHKNKKNCQMHYGPKALSTLSHSTPLV